jgi:hypothetical protein
VVQHARDFFTTAGLRVMALGYARTGVFSNNLFIEHMSEAQVLSLLALLVQKCKH